MNHKDGNNGKNDGTNIGKNNVRNNSRNNGESNGKNSTEMEKNGFYTQKRYERSNEEAMTSSMEDYLEMICRTEEGGLPIRVSLLAQSLHVRPSSVSKMLENLRRAGYIDFRKYGSILVTDKGREEGRYLLHRHEVLHDFFCALNHTDNELEQVEKIEHFINRRTVSNMEEMIPFMKSKHALALHQKLLYNPVFDSLESKELL